MGDMRSRRFPAELLATKLSLIRVGIVGMDCAIIGSATSGPHWATTRPRGVVAPARALSFQAHQLVGSLP